SEPSQYRSVFLDQGKPAGGANRVRHMQGSNVAVPSQRHTGSPPHIPTIGAAVPAVLVHRQSRRRHLSILSHLAILSTPRSGAATTHRRGTLRRVSGDGLTSSKGS